MSAVPACLSSLPAWSDGYPSSPIHPTPSGLPSGARTRMYRLYLAGALRVQPLVVLRQGDLAATEHALEEGLSLARAMPYPHGEGRLLKVYGQLHLGIWPAANRRRRGCGWRRRIPSSADWAPAGIWSTSSSCWLTRHGQTPMMCAATALSASRASYDYCEDQRIAYTIGLSRNTRLETFAAPLTEDAQWQRAQTGEMVRLLDEGTYQADSWRQPRRVAYKAEALDKVLNLRFVVTTRADPPDALYAWYTRRGEHPELCIKDLKDGCFADRLSCRRFWANQFRLLLHSAAYWLLDTLRRWRAQRQIPHLQLGTLRLRLLKIGGWARERLGVVHLHLASSHPGETLWYLLAARPNRL